MLERCSAATASVMFATAQPEVTKNSLRQAASKSTMTSKLGPTQPSIGEPWRLRASDAAGKDWREARVARVGHRRRRPGVSEGAAGGGCGRHRRPRGRRQRRDIPWRQRRKGAGPHRHAQTIAQAERRAVGDSSEGSAGNFGEGCDGRRKSRRACRRESRQLFSDAHRREVRYSTRQTRTLIGPR